MGRYPGVPFSRVERILRRGPLVAALVGLAQAAAFAVGWVLVYQDTHVEVARTVEDVVVQSNVAAAEAVVRALDGIPSVDERGSASWERTQRVVEDLVLGGDGFACVLDSEGRIACHPDIREQPGLRDVRLADTLVASLSGEALGPLGDLAPGTVTRGVGDFGLEGKHYLATLVDPDSGAQLIVHQPVSGLTAASAHVTSSMLTSMLGFGGLVVALTALLATLLVRAHDRTMVRWNTGLERIVDERTAQLVESHRTILFGIAKLAEYRDNDTGLHVERMCAYSAVIAREYQRRFGGVEDQWVDDLGLAAAMHDIGKVSIPDAILLKPGKLTAEEFGRMRRHTTVGEEALQAVREKVDDTRLLDLGIEIAGGHHERWDGTGYPRGLAAEFIPLSARIVAVADVFDALMSKRVYKDAMPFEGVRRIVREGSGAHFDPDVVACFEAVADELGRIHAELQDGGGPASPLPHVEDPSAQPVTA